MDYGSGLKGALRTASLILLLFLTISTIILIRFVDGIKLFDTVAIEVSDIIPHVAIYLSPLLMLMPLSFIAYCYMPGNPRRLAAKIVSSILMIVVVIMMAGDIILDKDVISLFKDAIVLEGALINLDVTDIRLLLLPIPFLELILSYLEYRNAKTQSDEKASA